ncbi:MAG: hypothetical protein KC877_04990 [Candidatus Kaiserbacteria bacterium]|nr:hypothetical protein [Candidatus Kaiserbacteria bacterium]MCB9816077.1 hypothetical protein [Candidatus Nomurabacteria bacterium]
MNEKLKSWLADDSLYFVTLLILVGIVSFGLGQRSVAGELRPASPAAGVIFSEAPPMTEIVTESTQSTTQVVASRSGTKYHLLDCPGVAQIKEENKVYFESFALAEAAGYTPAANCPGL